MISNYIESHRVEITECEIHFYVDSGGGLAFPCDEDGTPILTNPAAKANYEYAMSHPEKYPYEWNRVYRSKRSYWEPPSGTCKCGEHITLTNQYHGACECPSCGQWYNIFGQELLSPEDWDMD